MPVRHLLHGFWVLFWLVGNSNAVFGADWTQWGGRDGRNMISDERGLPESFVPGKKSPNGEGIDLATTENVKWSVRLGACAYGNPTIADGRIFVGTDDVTLADDDRFERTRGGLVKCLDEATGKLLWQLVVPHRDQLPKDAHFSHQFLGTCSSPTVDDGRVYVIATNSDLVCLDAVGLLDGNDGPFTDEARYMVPRDKPPVELNDRDADILWKFDMIDALGVVPHDAASCSALAHGPVVYVGTSNGVDKPHTSMPDPRAPSLIALDKKTGRLVAADGEKIGTRMYHAQWSPPSLGVVDGRALVFFGGGDGVCYAFEAIEKIDESAEEPVELKTVWSYDCNPPHYKFRDGKPVPYYDGDKRKKRGNTNDGTYVGPSQIIGTPVFHDGRVYIAIGQDPAHGRGRGMLHAIDASGTGDITASGKVWTYDGIERSLSTVAIADGLLYAADVAGTLYCLDVATGKCLGTHETDTETWGSPLVADGKIYWGTKRNFYVFAAGKQLRRLHQIYLGAAVYTTPIACNGVLYVTSQRYLWAVQKQ